jgi:hypothetical protein
MHLLPLLEAERKSGAIRYENIRQSPKSSKKAYLSRT